MHLHMYLDLIYTSIYYKQQKSQNNMHYCNTNRKEQIGWITLFQNASSYRVGVNLCKQNTHAINNKKAETLHLNNMHHRNAN